VPRRSRRVTPALSRTAGKGSAGRLALRAAAARAGAQGHVSRGRPGRPPVTALAQPNRPRLPPVRGRALSLALARSRQRRAPPHPYAPRFGPAAAGSGLAGAARHSPRRAAPATHDRRQPRQHPRSATISLPVVAC